MSFERKISLHQIPHLLNALKNIDSIYRLVTVHILRNQSLANLGRPPPPVIKHYYWFGPPPPHPMLL